VDALFAINELYPIGYKKSIQILERTTKRPEKFGEKVESILNINKGDLVSKAKELRNLFEQTVSLTNGTYYPYFIL
jgi:hypothetical protein